MMIALPFEIVGRIPPSAAWLLFRQRGSLAEMVDSDGAYGGAMMQLQSPDKRQMMRIGVPTARCSK